MRRLERFDPWLLACIGALLAIGLVAVCSASLDVASVRYGDAWRIARRWLVYVAVALGTIAIVARIDPKRWRSVAPWAALAAPVLLLLPHLPGIGLRANGAARWISLAGISVQPVEIVRVIFVLYAAHFFATQLEKDAAPPLASFLVWCALLEGALLLQPDFGNAALFALLAFGFVVLAGMPVRRWLPLMLLAALGFGALLWIEPYRVQRLMSFLDPWADPFGAGYQLTQSLLAYGAGGLWGAGIGAGVQKLFYLPEVFTDFIAAAIGEEMGLWGIALVILAEAGIVLRLLQLAFRQHEPYQALLLAGVAAAIGLRAVVNLAVTMGLLPTKGLPLPLVSYGGSALWADAFLLGCAFAVQRRTPLFAALRLKGASG